MSSKTSDARIESVREERTKLGVFPIIAIILNIIVPFYYAKNNFFAWLIIIAIWAGVPIWMLIFNYITTRRIMRLNSGRKGRGVLLALAASLGASTIGLLIGTIMIMDSSGNVQACGDSCSTSNAISMFFVTLLLCQMYLIGAYIGIIVGLAKD